MVVSQGLQQEGKRNLFNRHSALVCNMKSAGCIYLVQELRQYLQPPTSHIRVLEFKSQLHLQCQLPVYAHSGRQKLMNQALGALPTLWQTWVEFRVHGFWLTQLQVLPLGSEQVDKRSWTVLRISCSNSNWKTKFKIFLVYKCTCFRMTRLPTRNYIFSRIAVAFLHRNLIPFHLKVLRGFSYLFMEHHKTVCRRLSVSLCLI